MKILLLEDQAEYADTIRESLEANQAELGRVHIERISSELEFRRKLHELVSEPFDAAIFDVMFRWCSIEDFDDAEESNPPQEVQDETHGVTKWRAGFRCKRIFLDALSASSRPPVPCLLYTILEPADLEESLQTDETTVVTKQGDIQPLVRALKAMVRPNRP